MNKKHFRIACGTLIALLASAAQAVPITGRLNNAGSASVNMTTNTVTMVSTTSPVTLATGDFAGIATVQIPASFIYPEIPGPWTSSNPIWTGGGFSFDLTLITLVSELPGDLLLFGRGVASGNGFDPTPGSWSFSADDPANTGIFSWSASTVVPEPGMLMLLGAGFLLIGANVSRRRRGMRGGLDQTN